MSPTSLLLRRIALQHRVHDALIEARYARERGLGWLATRLADAAEEHWIAGCRVLDAVERQAAEREGVAA